MKPKCNPRSIDTPGFVWRYGIMENGYDLTEMDQWISKRYLPKDAPAALEEALERFIRK
jgi:hypothetical protein